MLLGYYAFLFLFKYLIKFFRGVGRGLKFFEIRNFEICLVVGNGE